MDVERLDNGNTLICDYWNSSVIEFDSSGTIVWQKNDCSHPIDAERLLNGNTLIVETLHGQRVYEVDSSGTIVWEKSGLNWPVDAERICMTELEIGDITGGFGVSSSIINNGSFEAKNVEWKIKFNKGIITIPWGSITTGGPVNIQSQTDLPISTFVLGIGGLIGFGSMTITVSAEAENAEYVEKTIPAIVFLFIVII